MRTFTVAQESSFFGPVQTLCVLVRIAKKNGDVIRLSTHDGDLTFGGEIYRAENGVLVEPLSRSGDMSPDTASIAGIADGVLITEEDLRVGAFDNASVTLYQVDWLNPEVFMVLMRGSVVQVDHEEAAWEFRLESRKSVLQRSIGEVYSPFCAARLGDGRCGVNLDGNDALGDPIKAVFTVESVGEATIAAMGPDLWLCAADLEGYIADGAKVLSLSDRSASLNHATGVSATAPTFDEDGYNDQPTMAFESTQFLSLTTGVDLGSDYTIITVGDTMAVPASAIWSDLYAGEIRTATGDAGLLSEIIVFKRTLSVSETDLVERYIANRYWLTAEEGTFRIAIWRDHEDGATIVRTWTGSVEFKVPETSPEELKGSIVSATVDLVSEGFQIGQVVTVSGTANNDGLWRVVNSQDDGKRIFVVGLTEGKKDPVAETVSATLEIDASYTPSEYWAHGKIEWATGRNAGLTSDVYSQESDGGTGAIIGLAVPPPYPVNPGDSGFIYAGCDGRRQTCKKKFNNLRRFRGYPDLPGWDALNAYPDKRPTDVKVT